MRTCLPIALLLLAPGAHAEPEVTVRLNRASYTITLPEDVDATATLLADAARLEPVQADDPSQGLRLTRVKAGGLVAEAGLREGDVVRSMNERRALDVSTALRVLREASDRGTLSLRVVRDGQRLGFTYRIDGPFGPASPVEWIRLTGDHRWSVQRDRMQAFLTDPAGAARSARVIPHFRNGAVHGFKLVGIRRTSVPAALGLRSGDVVTALNDLPLTSPQAGFEAWSRLGEATDLTLDVTRRGQPMTFRYTLVDDVKAPPAAGR